MITRYLVVFGASVTQFTVIGILFSYGVFFKNLKLSLDGQERYSQVAQR